MCIRDRLNALSPAISQDPRMQYDVAKHSQVVAASACLTAVGKLTSGTLIDAFDARATQFVLFLASGLLNFLLANVQRITDGSSQANFQAFLAIASVNAVVTSATFAAAIKFTHIYYRPAQWGKAVTAISVAWRTGQILNTLSMSSFLASGGTWTQAMTLAASVTTGGSFIILVLYCFEVPPPHLRAANEEEYLEKMRQHDALAPPHQSSSVSPFTSTPAADADNKLQPSFRYLPSFREGKKCDAVAYSKSWGAHVCRSYARWRAWLTNPSFVLMCAVQSCLECVVGAGFEGFVGLMVFNTFHLPRLQGASVSLSLPSGLIASLVLGYFVIEKLTKPSQANAVLLLLFALVFAVVGLESVVRQQELAPGSVPYAGMAMCLFFMGAGGGYTLTTTTVTFAMHVGGRDHVAMATQTMLGASSVVAAAFAVAVGRLARVSWAAVVGLQIAFAVVALVALTLFHWAETVAKKVRNKQRREARARRAQRQMGHLHHLHRTAIPVGAVGDGGGGEEGRLPAHRISFAEVEDTVVHAVEEWSHRHDVDLKVVRHDVAIVAITLFLLALAGVIIAYFVAVVSGTADPLTVAFWVPPSNATGGSSSSSSVG